MVQEGCLPCFPSFTQVQPAFTFKKFQSLQTHAQPELSVLPLATLQNACREEQEAPMERVALQRVASGLQIACSSLLFLLKPFLPTLPPL